MFCLWEGRGKIITENKDNEIHFLYFIEYLCMHMLGFVCAYCDLILTRNTHIYFVLMVNCVRFNRKAFKIPKKSERVCRGAGSGGQKEHTNIHYYHRRIWMLLCSNKICSFAFCSVFSSQRKQRPQPRRHDVMCMWLFVWFTIFFKFHKFHSYFVWVIYNKWWTYIYIARFANDKDVNEWWMAINFDC